MCVARRKHMFVCAFVSGNEKSHDILLKIKLKPDCSFPQLVI